MRKSLEFVPGFGITSAAQRREADLFLEDLMRGSPQLARGGEARRRSAVRLGGSAEAFDEVVETCGFFGSSARRTEQEVRDAVVRFAEAEWAAWHSAAGAPVRESDVTCFGRLFGYYLAAVGNVLPDTLTALQANAIGAGINYSAVVAPGASSATVDSEAVRIRGLLLAGVPGASASGLAGAIEEAVRRARQANRDNGAYKSWSAVFVSACVRGAAIALSLETVVPPRTHVDRDGLFDVSIKHIAYTVTAFRRRRASPPKKGTYHAFAPSELAPRLGDIIVQDRQHNHANQVVQFANIETYASGLETHGDIVVEVRPDYVVTLGGNLSGSVRRRRYPLDENGLLVVNAVRRYVQEDNAGVLAALPPALANAPAVLGDTNTRRIFALLSPVEDCIAVLGQQVPGGVLV